MPPPHFIYIWRVIMLIGWYLTNWLHIKCWNIYLFVFYRNKWSYEFQVRIRIALYSLTRIFPEDHSTIDWLQFAELRHRTIPLYIKQLLRFDKIWWYFYYFRKAIEDIIKNYTEINEFIKTIDETDKKSKLCTKWMMLLLVERFAKSEMYVLFGNLFESVCRTIFF